MINKKICALALSLVALGMASCGEESSSKATGLSTDSSASVSTGESSHATGLSADSEEDPELPVEEGMTTLYIEFAPSEEGIDEIPASNSPFITGGFCGWATNMAGDNKPLEMYELEGTDYWYTFIDNELFEEGEDAEAVATRGYQLTLGWNSESGAALDQQGIDWSCKADYNALYPGTAHPKFDNPVDGIVKLTGCTDAVIADPLFPDENSDDHWMADPETFIETTSFSSSKPDPVAIEEYDLTITITNYDEVEGLSDCRLFGVGAYNGWNGDFETGDELTVVDGEVVIHFENVFSGVKQEFQIVAQVGDDGFWDHKLQNDNLSWVPMSVDEGEGSMEVVWTGAL